MKFRITSGVFIVAVIAAFLLAGSYTLAAWLIGGITLAYLIVIGLGSYAFHWNFFLKAVHHGQPGKLCITFDDGPHPVHTPRILDVLQQYHAPATFFMIGKEAEKYGKLVKQIADAGHTIGNHSYHHSNMHGLLPAKKVRGEIKAANELLHRLSGRQIAHYRPPFGVTNPNIAQAVEETGVIPVGWDIRSLDTTIKDEEKLLQRILNKIPNGTILLLHDNQPVTVKLLPQILAYCAKNNIEIIDLPQAIGHRPQHS